MGKNVSSRIRSTATRAWGVAQTTRLRDIRIEGAGIWPEVADWIAHILPFLRKVVVSLLLLSALVAVHFFGFLNSMPENIQRLVATSFAPEFSAIFMYYAALALLAARLGTYAVAAMVVSKKGWTECRQASKSKPLMRKYLRNAKQKFSILEWPIFVLAPFLLGFIYADWKESTIAFAVITLVFILLSPIAIPQATLAPKRYFKRLSERRPSLRHLRNNVNVLVLFAVALLAMSFYLGKARFGLLAKEAPVLIRSSMYSGVGIILAQTETATLVLERHKNCTHNRYIFFKDGFLTSETKPRNPELFRPLTGESQSNSAKVVSAAVTDEEISLEAACRSSSGR